MPTFEELAAAINSGQMTGAQALAIAATLPQPNQGGGPPAPAPAATAGTQPYRGTTSQQFGTTPAPYDVLPGYQWQVDALGRQHETALQGQQAAAAMARQQAQQQFEAAQTQINQQFTAQQDALNRAFDAAMQAQDRALQQALLDKRITADQFTQARALAQQEAEFARTIAFQTIQADRDFQLNSARVEIDQAAQLLAERQMHASLAANPQDTVLYEFFKRGAGMPEAQQAAAGGAAPAAAGAGSQFSTLSGTPYEPPAPAYSDATLQQMVSAIYGGGSAQAGQQGIETLYNPGLSGTGAFGAQIQAPNAISRRQGTSMSDSEMGVLSSFLKAGVEVPGMDGKRVSINPNEYFEQTERSWVPTMNGGIGKPTEYR